MNALLLFLRCRRRQLESEKFAGILEADVLDHRAHEPLIVGQFSIFHFPASHVAEHAAKIFMAGE